jgi:hypothetical protein
MFKSFLLATLIISCTLPCLGKKKERPPDPAWAEITARGRMLAEYDAAAWHATDAVVAMHPAEGSFNGYVAKKSDTGWVVAFGRLNNTRNKLQISYLATQVTTSLEFKVTQNIPPQEDAGYFYLAFKALETSRSDFHGENRPYNAAILPADSNQMYVYIYPAQTTTDIYPLGGDVRYRISLDGSTIVEKRPLHKAILEIRFSNDPARKSVAGSHSHVLSDIPEDTDVFHVLTRKPSIPEFIGAGNHVYSILVDGTIVLEK